ncbi:52c4614b-276f-4d64-a7be-c08f166d872e [Thermothielavioides terrestris]|uniref:52c4614b-276f-4d64-a7be-c08f166d872e n=1 Tax=Thermothielavioides terrestris TaxID=2587410 RepID=A0A3S4D2S0_9PEZI|nr:52c4614b-276f-4d64-a7be-c08f166d872e [Thermothielavioides terrestris]
MPEVYRESRYVRERERDSSPSSDEEYKRTTVRRYKVKPDRVERVERDVDIVEVDRRMDRLYIPERPRSAFDPSPHSATYVERQVIEREREREPRDEHYTRVDRVEYRGDGPRGTVVERERVVERDDRDVHLPERTRTVVERDIVERDRDAEYHRERDRGRVIYEATKEVDRVDHVYSPRDLEHRSYWDDEEETEVRVERRVERRDSHGHEIRVERRVEERREEGPEGERWRKETEYYEPAQGPIVIRPRPAEQKIILQEAPPTTVVIREQTPDTREVAVARRASRDGEYYYHRESREVGPYRGERREEEVAVARYEDDQRHRHHRHHHHHHRHHRHHHDAYSDAESDDGYYVKRTVVRRERSESSSPHRKRHLAEGALAGAGISAILASRRDSNGEFRQHRGRKVLAGAALGALGTEVVRRAHSAYQERFGDDDRRERSRSRSRAPHSRLKTGLGIAAVALAAAGAAKYYQSSKIEKEEMNRGRALHRDSDSERSPSRKRSRSRASSLAKAGLGAAALTGLVQHYRHKSKSRDGKSRSRSRLRTGAEMLAAGLAGAGAKKLYDRHKEKKEAERDRDRGYSDDEYYEDDARDYNRRSRSRSLSRSGPTYPDGDPSAADPELGMVEYGAHPLYANPAYPADGDHMGRAAAGYDSAAEYESAVEERSRRRRRSHGRGRARGEDDYSADSEAETDHGKKAAKKRSGSRLRDLAAGAAAAGAAAIGIKKFNERRAKEKEREEKEEAEREKDRERNRERERDKGKERDRRRYGDEASADEYDGYGRRGASPPHASGGFYNPPPPAPPAPPAGMNGFTQHPNVATTNLHQQYTPYPGPGNADFTAMPPPPPNSAGVPDGAPPPFNPKDPEHVSEASHVGRSTPEPEPAARSVGGDKKSCVTPTLAHVPPTPVFSEADPETPRTSKSVTFIPLSPKSSATLRRHREEQATKSEAEADGSDSEDHRAGPDTPRRRRNSDPSSDRPLLSTRRARDSAPETDDSEEDVIEMLPDRFDSHGRPLGGSAAASSRGPRLHSRRGDFEYRNPRGAGGLNMRGSWGVAGTDAEAVERIVQNVTGVLEGRGSWMGLLGGFLNGSLLQGADIGGGGEGLGRISDRDRPRGRERGDDSYDDDDYDDRKRRRRRMEEPRERGVSRAQTWG